MTPKSVCLAEKQGFPREKMAFYFGLFWFFGDFLCCKPLMVINMHLSNPSEKNRARNTTIGFWFYGESGNIVS